MRLRTFTMCSSDYLAHKDTHDGLCFGCGQWVNLPLDGSSLDCSTCRHRRLYSADEALEMGRLVLTDCEAR